jgi:hypoxia up-regulated 1
VATLAALAVLCAALASAAIISVDFGAESFKIAMIKSGHPLDVVLNKESKRKTPSFLYVSDTERLYGNDAKTLVSSRSERPSRKRA